MKRAVIAPVNNANSTKSRMKKIVPITWRPRNLFGVCAMTTATAPVDMVHANHGLHWVESAQLS